MRTATATAINGDVQIHYDVFGDADDPTLLLVNGMGSQCINCKDAWCEMFAAELVIHGDKDDLIFAIGGERTAELIPGARFELIAGMGHDYPPGLWRQWTDLVVGHIRARS